MASCKALNIAFAGLGAMGFGMASHLVKEGHNVTGYDVYEPSLEKFRAVGGRVSSSPKEVAGGNEYFICMVANSQQAESVLFDSANGAIQGMNMHFLREYCTSQIVTQCSSTYKLNRHIMLNSAGFFLKTCSTKAE